MIAHGSEAPNSFIVVFYVDGGAILSARKYSKAGFANYNDNHRSILISSGLNPMAYVLSNKY